VGLEVEELYIPQAIGRGVVAQPTSHVLQPAVEPCLPWELIQVSLPSARPCRSIIA